MLVHLCHDKLVQCRGQRLGTGQAEDDGDPVEELSDPVPAFQAIRRRMLAGDAGRDPISTIVTVSSCKLNKPCHPFVILMSGVV